MTMKIILIVAAAIIVLRALWSVWINIVLPFWWMFGPGSTERRWNELMNGENGQQD